MWTNFTFTLKLGLKDFLTSCLCQFKVYIWPLAWCYNNNKYLDEIKYKIDISLDPSRVLGQELCQKNDHFSPIILRNQFSTRTLMFSFQNFPTPMLGTLCLLMIPHINLYLMICVLVYFWNCLKVHVMMGIICSPPFFLTWFRFIHMGLMYNLTWNIILLGLLEA